MTHKSGEHTTRLPTAPSGPAEGYIKREYRTPGWSWRNETITKGELYDALQDAIKKLEDESARLQMLTRGWRAGRLHMQVIRLGVGAQLLVLNDIAESLSTK